MKEWEAKAYFIDPGNKGFGMGWAAADTDTADWKPMDRARQLGGQRADD